MKKYIKPEIEVVTISSSAPIAFKSCTGDNRDDYDFVQDWIDGQSGGGGVCTNYQWVRGS